MTSTDELKMLFQMAYVPVSQVMQRLNGKDFIGVAVPLMDSIRKETSDPRRIKEAAQVFVYSFNDMLNPKLTASWEKGLDLVARKEIKPDEFMVKLEKYIVGKIDKLVFK